VPVYVDSPMALDTLRVYREAIARSDPDIQIDGGISGDPFHVPHLREAHSVEESKALNHPSQPSVIVSASGMATGGRVVHHLAHLVSEPENTVILVGFQAEGTRGRRLLEGETELKLLGRYVRVKADIVDLPAFSVHADAGELLDWIAAAPVPPDTIYAVHGEPAAAAALARAVHERLDGNAVVPKPFERVRLDRMN
jgi:metallo-beta-lactamase family protein